MNVCIVYIACPTYLTLTSQQLDAVEKLWCRLTREALQIESAAVCVSVCMVALGRNVMEGIPGSSVNEN
jgi:deoxyribose-phosphate aldolase